MLFMTLTLKGSIANVKEFKTKLTHSKLKRSFQPLDKTLQVMRDIIGTKWKAKFSAMYLKWNNTDDIFGK